MDTSRQTTWPPPPDIPNPLAEHDAFLTALICGPVTKAPLTRLRLYQELRQKMGSDLRHSYAIVNDYCERYGIFPQPPKVKKWLPLLLALAPFVWLVILLLSLAQLGRGLASAHTHLARHLLLWKQVQLIDTFCCIMFVFLLVLLVCAPIANKHTRRQAEEARRKVGCGLDGGATP